MLKGRRLLVHLGAVFVILMLLCGTGMTAMATNTKNYLDTLNGGVAQIIDPSVNNTSKMNDSVLSEQLKALEEE